MTTTTLPTPSPRGPQATAGLPLVLLTGDDAPRRSLCGSCAGCPRAAVRAAADEKV